MFKESNIKESILNQVYGHEDNRIPCIAIIGDNGQQIGPWIKCKDYIQDVIWGSENGKSFNVHGFSYTPEMGTLKKLRLAYRWKGKTKKEVEAARDNVKNTLHDIETRTKIGRKSAVSKVFKIGSAYGFVINPNQKWRRSIALVSFLAFICRISVLNSTGKFEDVSKIKDTAFTNDINYLTYGKKFVSQLMEKGIDSFETTEWDKINSAGHCHPKGFVSWSKAH